MQLKKLEEQPKSKKEIINIKIEINETIHIIQNQ